VPFGIKNSRSLRNIFWTLENNNISVRVATAADKHYAETITREMELSAQARGTGIAKRSPEYIQRKMEEGKAVIAVTSEGEWVGFCYIEAWQHEKYVANSGLIVAPQFRHTGVAKEIKKRIFELSRERYPDAKIFGLTTGLAVMKINSNLGYKPVTYSELTTDEEFWKGCQSCVNYEILMMKNRQNCLCTAMLYDPATAEVPKPAELPKISRTVVTSSGKLRKKRKRDFKGNLRLFERWIRFKQYVLLKSRRKNGPGGGNVQAEKKFSIFGLFSW
jgi:N-acetylglutamate synthase-like GNAT family acetyltransferase